MSLICSSPGALKVVHKKLLNDSKLKKRYLNFDFRADSIDHEIEHENGSAWESFMNTHLIAHYTATIVVTEKPFEEWVKP
ncbi:unnamed protein product [Cuscuta campestris]|uniref:Uncharacterized protein n=1 Tax=Cuscuta campestris TaxID=132261 RepID=A0A484LHG8_9ASTE|nr:unnamed protein product [Cuscuta campestris]